MRLDYLLVFQQVGRVFGKGKFLELLRVFLVLLLFIE